MTLSSDGHYRDKLFQNLFCVWTPGPGWLSMEIQMNSPLAFYWMKIPNKNGFPHLSTCLPMCGGFQTEKSLISYIIQDPLENAMVHVKEFILVNTRIASYSGSSQRCLISCSGYNLYSLAAACPCSTKTNLKWVLDWFLDRNFTNTPSPPPAHYAWCDGV